MSSDTWWSVVVTCGEYSDGQPIKAFLEHKGRTYWRKRTAKRYAEEYTRAHGNPAELVEETHP